MNVAAYATRPAGGEIWITVINKDLVKDVDADISLPLGYIGADEYWLKAPTAQSTEQVTFANAAVTSDGKWSAGSPLHTSATRGAVHITLPHASAVVCKLRSQ